MITIKEKIINTAINTIQEFNLIEINDRIIIGISGGPDSLSLFFILNELKNQYNLSLMFAHVNHMLRKEESDKDEQFVAELAEKFDVQLMIKRVNIQEIKKRKKNFSTEEIGHHERYKFFQSLLKKNRFNKIALGHNLDDSIENYFLKSFDGGSLKSLAGIKPFENSIIRPLIRCSKNDLKRFLKAYHIPFCTDCSNLDNSYPRNWIRNKLIPYIEKNYKPIKNNISNLMDILHYENIIIQNQYNQFSSKNIFFNDNLYTAVLKKNRDIIKYPGLSRRIIKEILLKLKINYNFQIIGRLARFANEKNKTSIRVNGLFVWKHGKYIIFSMKNYLKDYKININKIPDKIIIENLNLSAKIDIVEKKNFNIKDSLKKNLLCFDKNRINKIIIRQKKIGDYIMLMNTDFCTKLKKLLTDLKLPVPLKKMVPIIESNNEIIGIYLSIFPIYLKNRINEKYKVTKKTREIIQMEFNQWQP